MGDFVAEIPLPDQRTLMLSFAPPLLESLHDASKFLGQSSVGSLLAQYVAATIELESVKDIP